ncbi:putative ribonuclease H-like domain-containing protein [Tanacetum coccineum]
MTQRKYALELLHTAGVLDVKHSYIHIYLNIKLNDTDGDPLPDASLYKTLVGKLLYLKITRPDLSYAAHCLIQFSHLPRTPYFDALIKVLRYIKLYLGQGLYFPTHSSLQLKAYCDSDWANLVSKSSTEAEYRALADDTCELTWLQSLLLDLQVPITKPIPIMCDNQSSISLASNLVQHAKPKYIEIDYHFVKDKIKVGIILPTFIPSSHQAVDVHIKGLMKNLILLKVLKLHEDEDIIDQGLGSTSGIRACALRKFNLEVMEFETAQSNTTAKLPILKLENGNSWISVPQTTQKNGFSVTKMSMPETAEERANKKNDVKARSLLLMALSNEHQLIFNQYTDAKTMFAAIETRFGGNEATKKTQKALLKQQYENFNASSTELLDSIFNRLQKLWNTHVVVWMNKADIKTISIDDLYNNFKIVEQDVKKFVGSNVNTASPQACSASLSDNVVYDFMVENPNGSNLLHQDLEQIHEDDLEAMDLKWQLSLLSMRAKRYFHRIGKKIFINGNDTAGYDKTKSDMAEEQIQTNIALMAFSDSELNQTEFKASTYKRGLATGEEQLVTYRKNEVLFSKEVAVLKREVACKDYEISVLKSDFEKVKQEKEGYNVVPPPHPLIYNAPTKLDLSYSGLDEFKEPEFKGYGPRNDKQESNISCDKKSKNSEENTDDSLVKEQVSEDDSSTDESPLKVDNKTVFDTAKKV